MIGGGTNCWDLNLGCSGGRRGPLALCLQLFFVSDDVCPRSIIGPYPFLPVLSDIMSSLRLPLPSKFPVTLPSSSTTATSTSTAAALLSQQGRLRYEPYFFIRCSCCLFFWICCRFHPDWVMMVPWMALLITDASF